MSDCPFCRDEPTTMTGHINAANRYLEEGRTVRAVRAPVRTYTTDPYLGPVEKLPPVPNQVSMEQVREWVKRGWLAPPLVLGASTWFLPWCFRGEPES